ncbi:hypothetical protein DFQ29_007572 [Apophysomyces sp. BC1021]|nr:hypothetical protein DFQ29_007572 [Apophysomyces sp. BC1021]
MSDRLTGTVTEGTSEIAATDMNKLVAVLFSLRSICMETQNSYIDAIKDNTKLMTGFRSKTLNNCNPPKDDRTRPFWNPPSDTCSNILSPNSLSPNTPSSNTISSLSPPCIQFD